MEQAEKIEQEFVSLMTGQKRSRKDKLDAAASSSRITRHSSSPSTLFMVGDLLRYTELKYAVFDHLRVLL